MYPLDFEEFLWAANELVLIDYIKECVKKKFGNRVANSYIVHPKQFSIDEKGMKVPPYMFFFML